MIRRGTLASIVAGGLALACSEPPPRPPNWVEVGRDDQGTAYLADRSSIGRPGAYWRITVRTEPLNDAGAIIKFWVVCDEGRLAVRHHKRMDDKPGHLVGEGFMEFEDPGPGSIGEAIVTEACRAT